MSCSRKKLKGILALQPSRNNPAFLASLRSSCTNISEYLEGPKKKKSS